MTDPHLNQTKLNGLLPLTIPGVLDQKGTKDKDIDIESDLVTQ